MKIEYDKQADALYITFRKGKPYDNIDVKEGITVDFDKKRHILGIEILDARRRVPASELSCVTIENFIPIGK